MLKLLVRLIPYLFLAGVALLSYHQLLQMYFWRDDYTGLYFSQRELIGDPAFAYPYHVAFYIESFFWRIYGLNASLYFLTVVLFYVSATCLLFYFLQRLFVDKKIAFFSGLIFAAGYLGQDAMKMTMGDGLGTITALNVLLLNLSVFLSYLKTRKTYLFILSAALFFMTVEVAPQRTSSSLLIFILLDWLISFREKKNILIRNLTFIVIFLVQYFIHPSVWILGYRVISPGHFLGIFASFSPGYILNFLGTFWNMLFPSHIQLELNTALGIYKDPLNFFKFLLTGIPAYFFALLSIISLRLIRPSSFGFIYTGKIITVFTVFCVFLAYFILRITIDQTDQISIFNGGVFLSFLILWIGMGVTNSRVFSAFSLLAVFGMLAIFFLAIPERVLVSYNRYLLLPSFTVTLLPVIFTTKEFYQGKGAGRIFAGGLFFTFVFILVLPRLFIALSTQQEFVRSYSQHAKKFYGQLREILPDIDRTTLIYAEGETKELELSIGDAQRVGYLGSEVAVAINLNTGKENIILPQALDDIPGILEKNPAVRAEDVYTFIYTQQGLLETSKKTRELLSGKGIQESVLPTDWKKDATSNSSLDISFNPSFKIWTLQPIEVIIPLKAQTGLPEIEVFWEYNTYGAVHEERSSKTPFFADGQWHEYKFIIPAGGEYLKRIYFKNLSPKVEIGVTRMSYVGD